MPLEEHAGVVKQFPANLAAQYLLHVGEGSRCAHGVDPDTARAAGISKHCSFAGEPGRASTGNRASTALAKGQELLKRLLAAALWCWMATEIQSLDADLGRYEISMCTVY